MKRTLAEELAELATSGPAPDHDPQDLDFGTLPGNVDYVDDKHDDGTSEMPSKKIRGDISDMGQEYSGQQISVSSAFANGRFQAADEHDSDATASETSDASEEPFDVLAQPLANLQNGDGGNLPNGRQQSPAMQSPSDTSGADGDDVDALEREFDDVAATNAAAAAGRAAKADAERIRGIAAGRQKRLWEHALELRIRAQRAFTAAHRLPPPSAHRAVVAASKPLAAAFSSAQETALALLSSLLELQSALVGQNPAIADAAEGDDADKGHSEHSRVGVVHHGESEAAAQMWARIEDATAQWAPYRDASLDRWHRRAALSGGAAAGKPGLKALSQPLSVQVAAILAGAGQSHRLQLPRSNAQPVLCDLSSHRTEADAKAHAEGVAATVHSKGADQQRVADTYDDGDLYDQLLKAYLDSAAPGAGITLQRQPKRRKVVDRRASKGRKLRYHVHDKLVGFMTPVQERSHVDGLGPALFRNLFGHS